MSNSILITVIRIHVLTKEQNQQHLEAIQKRAIHIILNSTLCMPYTFMLDGAN